MAAESPIALIYGYNGSTYVETSIRAGIAVPSGQPGFIALGSDGTNTRYLRTASDGTVRVDPTGTTTQPISAASLPLPAGAATEATLATLLTQAGFEARVNTLGQKTMANSTPVVISSDQSAIPASQSGTWNINNVSGTISLPTGAATEATLATLLTTSAFQARIPVNGQAVMSASIPVVIASNQSVLPINDNAGSLTVDTPQLPAALVGGRLDVLATQSGTWTVQQGTPPWTNRIQDGAGSNLLAVDSSGRAAIQNQPNFDVALSTRATEATLASIKDTAGVKKITDALPVGDNRLGKVKLVDANDVALDLARDTTIPANTRGLMVMGEDASGKAQAADIRKDTVDNIRRLQIEGRVSVTAPVAPPSTTAVSIASDSPLSITSDSTTNYVITNAKTFYLQQVVAGSEGDTSERGSVVEVLYYDGSTEHIIERVYLNGFTTSISLNNINKSRDGTTMTGDGSTKQIRVRRRRLSGSSQEVDAVVRGYEQ